jgi:hypothetical protein
MRSVVAAAAERGADFIALVHGCVHRPANMPSIHLSPRRLSSPTSFLEAHHTSPTSHFSRVHRRLDTRHATHLTTHAISSPLRHMSDIPALTTQ